MSSKGKNGKVYNSRVNSARRPGWWTDWLEREEVDRKLASLIREPLTDVEIARRVGISDKSVLRFRRRNGIAPFRERMTA